MKSNPLNTTGDGKADDMSAPMWRASDSTLESQLTHADALRRQASSSIVRAAGQADDLVHRGLERARLAGSQMREQAARTGEMTVGYVKDQPMKAMAIAAAAGAVLAMLASLLARPRH